MRPKSQGFTLIELMLVVVILGLTTTVVMLSMPSMTTQQQDETQLAQLANRLALFQEQAETEGQTLGLYMNEHHYQFMTLKPQASGAAASMTGSGDTSENTAPAWVLYTPPRWQTQGDFDAGDEVQLSLSGLTLDEDTTATSRTADTVGETSQVTPQILILPGGEITPFMLTVTGHDKEQAQTQTLSVMEQGEITLNGENPEGVSTETSQSQGRSGS